MILFLNLLILSTTVILSLFLLGFKRIIDLCLGFFLLALTEMMLITQILSLFHLLAFWPFVIFQGLLLAAALSFWLVKGKPVPISRDQLDQFIRRGKSFLTHYRENWPVYLLLLGVFLIFMTRLFDTWLNFNPHSDSIYYHYPKIALWLQNRSMFFTRESALFISDNRIIGSPPVYEVAMMWFFLSLNSIRSIEIVELISTVFLAVAIVGITLEITGSRNAAVISGLLLFTFTVVVYDMAVANASITAISLLTAGLYFLKRYTSDSRRLFILFSSLGLALAFASKPTIYLLYPAMALIVFSLILLKKDGRLAAFRDWAVIGGASFIIIASSISIQNLILYRDPFMLDSWNERVTSDYISEPRCVVINSARYLYDRATPDLSLASIQSPLLTAYKSGWEVIFNWLNIDVYSDLCIKNPFDPLLAKPGLNITGLPLLAIALFFGVKNFPKDSYFRLWILVLWISQLLLFAATRPYSNSTFRYFVSSAAFLAIFLGDFFVQTRQKKMLLAGIFVILLYPGIAKAITFVRIEYPTQEAVTEAVAGRGGERDLQSILNGLIPPGSELVGHFPVYHTIDVALWGDSLANTVQFTDCEHADHYLRDSMPDFFVHYGKYPDWDFAACLATYQTESGNAIKEFLDQNYTTALERWDIDRYILVMERNDFREFLFNEFPPGRPSIFIDENLVNVVGGGPQAFFQRGTGLADADFLFALTVVGEVPSLPILLEFAGQTCTPDGMVQISVYDNAAQLILREVYQLNDGTIHFSPDLPNGINKVFVAEENCSSPVDEPLLLISVRVGSSVEVD